MDSGRLEAFSDGVFAVAISWAAQGTEYRCWGNRGGRTHAKRLARQAALTKKVIWTQNRQDRFLADVVHNREFYAAFLDIHDSLGGITLRVDRL